MSIERQGNWLGQQRIDVPDLRSIESAVAHDFDVLAGKVLTGDVPLIVKGFTISTTNAYGNPADELELVVAGGILLHSQASVSGTVYSVSATQASEVLNATNPKVSGSFSASKTNYVGLDLSRSADSETTDITKFLSASTLAEITKSVPKARTLSYRIVISSQPFTSSTNIAPIAKIVTDSSNNVTSITDARNLLFRLGTGSDNPNATQAFSWSDSDRRENPITYDSITDPDPFAGGDKELTSIKQWMDAVTNTIWESKSGQYWYSPTSRDGIKLAYGQPTVGATGDNFEWTLGSQLLEWDGLSVIFENSKDSSGSGTYYNTITAGSETVLDGQCLYVDLQRETNGASLVANVTYLHLLGSPTLPGSRLIIAWRLGDYVYTRDKAFEVGRVIPVATTTVSGSVKLNTTSVSPLDPFVTVADGSANAVAAGLTRGTLGAGLLSVGTNTTNDTSINVGNLLALTRIIGAKSLVIGSGNSSVGNPLAPTGLGGSAYIVDSTNKGVSGFSYIAEFWYQSSLGVYSRAGAITNTPRLLFSTIDADSALTNTLSLGTAAPTTDINIGRAGTGTTTLKADNVVFDSNAQINGSTGLYVLKVNSGSTGTDIEIGNGNTKDVLLGRSGKTTKIVGDGECANHLYFSGSNPTIATGITNRVTPKNICKAWGCIDVSSLTIIDGTNVSATVTLTNVAGTNDGIVVTIVNDIANDDYSIVATAELDTGTAVVPLILPHYNSKVVGAFTLVAYDLITQAPINMGVASVKRINFQVFGTQ